MRRVCPCAGRAQLGVEVDVDVDLCRLALNVRLSVLQMSGAPRVLPPRDRRPRTWREERRESGWTGSTGCTESTARPPRRPRRAPSPPRYVCKDPANGWTLVTTGFLSISLPFFSFYFILAGRLFLTAPHDL